MIRACVFLAFCTLSACLGDWGIDDEAFPCRGPEDCSESFTCDAVQFVCVLTGTETATTAAPF